MDNEKKLSESELRVSPMQDAQAMVKAEIETLMNDVETGLGKLEPSRVYTVDHMLFREVFLPMFMRVENPRYPEASISMWVQRISGNYYNPVSIIDQKGNVVATVPPMLDPSVLKIVDPMGQDKSKRRISDVWMTVSALAERAPNRAEKLFSDEVRDRLKLHGANEQALKWAECWNEVYEYYGHPIPYQSARDLINNVATPEKKDSTASVAASVEDDYSDDDYELA